MPSNHNTKNKVSGWLVVNKSPGITSNRVVNISKKIFKSKKAGHAGTLDKPASGILAVAIGEATKTIPFVTNSFKGYRFVVNLGVATDTDDATGKIIDQTDIIPTEKAIDEALVSFRGNILQVPPQYSSVKIDGQRAYKMAVSGQKVEIKPRPLKVKRLEFKGWISNNQIELEMDCSKGGYVRSIARDLGLKLGCLAHVDNLTRTWSGPFELAHAQPFSNLTEITPENNPFDWLLPLEKGFYDLPEINCNLNQVKDIRHGKTVSFSNVPVEDNSKVWVSSEGKAIAWGFILSNVFHPKRIINQY